MASGATTAFLYIQKTQLVTALSETFRTSTSEATIIFFGIVAFVWVFVTILVTMVRKEATKQILPGL